MLPTAMPTDAPGARSSGSCWNPARSPQASIGERLGLSAAGVRRHLDALIDAGDAQANAAAAWQQEGRGRPAKRYRLTAAGRAKLEHTYDDLASAAMRQLREIGGDDAVRTFARGGSTPSSPEWSRDRYGRR